METKVVAIGGKGITKRVLIGGNNPVTVQTMWKEGITDVPQNKEKFERILRQLNELQMMFFQGYSPQIVAEGTGRLLAMKAF